MTATIGIRLEDKSVWERRVPIVPSDIERLRSHHALRFMVESSPNRVYSNESFEHAGAEICHGLSLADVIFAVKEVPLDKLLPGKTYAFFAHVIKGQLYNMDLLQRLLDLRCTLIEYERITDENDRRLVFFGREAGLAGMIDTFHCLGQRLATAGFETPFNAVRQAFRYANLPDAQNHFADLGKDIRRGLELDDLPMVVGFTGYGHVSQGAQDIFDLLPYEEVAPEELAGLTSRRRGIHDRLFKVVFKKPHLAEPIAEGKSFAVDEYHSHPERYRGRLIRYLPFLSVLMHCSYWTDEFPRFLTRQQAMELWRRGERKLRVIGDVTCDIDGAIELTHKATQPDVPCYVYDPETDRWQDGLDGRGIAILAVDNLPCELPKESSDRFSHALTPFVPAIAAADYDRPFAELALPPEIHGAIVTHHGELTPGYRYLQASLEASGQGAGARAQG